MRGALELFRETNVDFIAVAETAHRRGRENLTGHRTPGMAAEETWALERQLIRTGPVTSCAWSPDGARLTTVGGGSVVVWDVFTGQKIHTRPQPTTRRAAASASPTPTPPAPTAASPSPFPFPLPLPLPPASPTPGTMALTRSLFQLNLSRLSPKPHKLFTSRPRTAVYHVTHCDASRPQPPRSTHPFPLPHSDSSPLQVLRLHWRGTPPS